ncbi:MAG: 2-oxoacid:acceptor oxidoreductase family protein [Myxococcales bacterium]|nr:2-oxoacid:acceptor oxidoreductase family protein [Myxococcales bacterium]
MDANSQLAARLDGGGTVDLRGDGKAGGGLVLVVQAFGAALAEAGYDVQDWPLFSSARKGANVRAYLRLAKGRVEATCQVTEPSIAVLMNEAAAEVSDFAEGTNGALYIVNTPADPESTARKHRLGGTVAAVSGDALGTIHLGRPLGNIAVYAALVRTTGLVKPDQARESLRHILEKRRLPARIVDSNSKLFDDALEKVRTATVPAGPQTDHRKPSFKGYGALPAGAQAALRAAKQNRTAGYGRPGIKVAFADPSHKCNGCALCVVQCPEGIIEFTPDPGKGPIVHGARFDQYCKVCRECVTACPLDLFSEIAAVVRPEEAAAVGGA